jgi:DNA-binding IclR family transcriptional regulator
MSKTTVLRLLSTLIQCGYIRRDQDNLRYKLGFKVLTLAAEFQKSIAWKEEAFPFIKQLQQTSGETINLAVIDGTDVVYIERIESTQIVRASVRVGKRLSIHCTALGKAILAHLDNTSIQRIIDEVDFVSLTANTISNKDVFMQCLEKVRREGYAVDDEENQEGVRCIAAPIFNWNNQVIGAVSVSGPTLRISMEHLSELAPEVKETANNISRSIGWHGI